MIGPFKGKWSFLSNFSPAIITYGGIVYPTAEHAYQASKDRDLSGKRWIARLSTPSQARRAGRRVIRRDDWEEMKLAVMEGILQKKFAIPHLRVGLLDTGDEELVEVNYWGDTFWGVCKGVGENHLGKLLMKIRKEIRDED